MDYTYPERTSEDFIKVLSEKVRKGWGITPLAGAGISSRSGILMGIEFSGYLAFTVFRSVVEQDEQAHRLGLQRIRLWNVRHDGWPELPKPFEVEAVRKWVAEKYESLCRACGVAVHFDPHDGYLTVWCLSAASIPDRGAATLDGQIRRPLLPAILRGERTSVDDEAVKDLLRAVGAEGAARGKMYRPNVSPDSWEGLEERAIRALHDWRAALHFLAELDAISVGGSMRPFVGQHEPSVIDSFNTHITRGRKPNLAHSMLAHLAEPLRTRIVLTTNFDTLLEDAFAQIDQPLTVFAVGSHSDLPPANTIHAQNTLVKLHGALMDTRADFSLDDMPSVGDKARFFHYITGGPPPKSTSNPLRREPQEQPPPFLPTHLLVIGYGGGDNRVIQQLKFVLDHSPDTLIFWVCHDNRNFLALQRLFLEKDYKDRIVATVTDRGDLLLLELHQELTCALPRGGFSYQFSHDVPPKLWKREEHRDKPGPGEGGKGGDEIARRVKALSHAVSRKNQQEREKQKEPLPTHVENRILFVDTASGLMAVLRDAFEILKRDGFSPIWVEMEDFANARELTHHLLQIIALRRGLFQLEHAVLMPHRFAEMVKTAKVPAEVWTDRFFQMARYFGIQTEKWVIFFYGRNVPGLCAGWDRSPWEKEQYKEFHEMLNALSANGFQLVYAPYSRRRMLDDRRKADATRLEEERLAVACGKNPSDSPPLTEDRWNADAVQDNWVDSMEQTEAAKYEEVKVAPVPSTAHYIGELLPFLSKQVVGSLYPSPSQTAEIRAADRTNALAAHFFYACSLFRRSRPLAALLSEGVFHSFDPLNSAGLDNDRARYAQVKLWIDTFRKQSFVWRKPSGNVWLYRDARLGMQSLLQKCRRVPLWRGEDDAEPCEFGVFLEARARIHFGIAVWYAQAFFTTGHSVPLIEALYHLYQSLIFAPHASRARPAKEVKNDSETAQYRRQLWIRSVNSLIKLLKIGRSALLFWLDQPAAESMFGPNAMDKVLNDLDVTWSRIAGLPLDIAAASTDGYVNNLKGLIRAEWETVWCEFERQPFQGVFESQQYGETEVFDVRTSEESGVPIVLAWLCARGVRVIWANERDIRVEVSLAAVGELANLRQVETVQKHIEPHGP
jgi:hypothetical protein